MFNYPGKTRMRLDLLFLMKGFRVTKVTQPVKALVAKACMTSTSLGPSVSLSPKALGMSLLLFSFSRQGLI